jgi:hypothetical protein
VRMRTLILLFLAMALTVSACEGAGSVRGGATDNGARGDVAHESQLANSTFTYSLNKATVRTVVPLAVGTKLEFSSGDLKPNEVLLLEKCGVSPCQSAKLIQQWKGSDSKLPDAVVISEAALYYFWIQRHLPDDSTGPVFGESSESRGPTMVFHYVSGTTVSVTVTVP